MSTTHTIMAVDTEFDRVSLLNWESSENTPIGRFLRELTRGGKRSFTSPEGMWLHVSHIDGGSTFIFEFGEETV